MLTVVPASHPERIDTLIRVETPEGVDLELRAAGTAPRAIAWALDLMLRVIVGLVLAMALGAFGAFGSGVLLLVMFALEWLYPVAFEVLRDGQTPGKAALKLQVLKRDGTPVDLAASALRNLMRAADFLPMLYGFGLVAMLTDRHFRRLGDLVAGTVVVHTPVHTRASLADDPEPRPPPVTLSHEEQRALIAWAQRRATLSEARVDELAAIVQPWLAPAGDTATRAERLGPLLGIAAWALGRRSARSDARRGDEERRRRP